MIHQRFELSRKGRRGDNPQSFEWRAYETGVRVWVSQRMSLVGALFVDNRIQQSDGVTDSASAPTSHVTRDSFPWFLRDLDQNPQRAAAGFHEFAWKLLRCSPPPRFQGLAEVDREDIIADLVVRWLSDDFAVLRRYRDNGRPFAGFLATAANNRATDRWRRIQDQRKRDRNLDEPAEDGVPLAERLSDGEVGHDERYEDRLKLQQVEECLGNVSERCQVLLHGAADGMKPRELTVLLGWPPDWNKKAHDALRECRRSLVRCMDKKN